MSNIQYDLPSLLDVAENTLQQPIELSHEEDFWFRDMLLCHGPSMGDHLSPTKPAQIIQAQKTNKAHVKLLVERAPS